MALFKAYLVTTLKGLTVSKFSDQQQRRQDVLFIMQRHQFHASNQWPIVGFVYEKTIMNLHGRWL